MYAYVFWNTIIKETPSKCYLVYNNLYESKCSAFSSGSPFSTCSTNQQKATLIGRFLAPLWRGGEWEMTRTNMERVFSCRALWPLKEMNWGICYNINKRYHENGNEEHLWG